MPTATVGDPQTGHGGLLTHVMNDRLNHLKDARVRNGWTHPIGGTIESTYFSSARMTQS